MHSHCNAQVNVALPATQWRTMFALAALPAALLGLGESDCCAVRPAQWQTCLLPALGADASSRARLTLFRAVDHT